MKSVETQKTIDLSYLNAARVVADKGGDLRLVLVGCGGTGSWLAPSIARLAAELTASGRRVMTMFVDHDRVEAKNVPRQNFCYAEAKGRPYKAVALAARFSAAWKVPILAITERFHENLLSDDFGHGMRSRRVDILNLMIGCVDNAKARRVMAQALAQNYDFMDHNTWWLDCGNADESGQVLLGSASTPDSMEGAFHSAQVCRALPSPALQAPDLLKEKPEEKSKNKLSCAELVMLNQQSLMVNQQVAAIAANYLLRLTTGKPLRFFATYFDQESGASSSKYVTPETVARIICQPVQHVMKIKTMKASEFVRGRRRAAG